MGDLLVTGTKLYAEGEEILTSESTTHDNIVGVISKDELYALAFTEIPQVQSGKITDSTGTPNYNKRIVPLSFQYDTAGRTITTTWVDGKIFANVVKTAGRKITMSYRIPSRNDDNSWGGVKTDFYYSIDNGSSWANLGSNGYGRGAMTYSGNTIHSDWGTLHLDLAAITNATQIRIKFRHATYGGSGTVNSSHAITGGAANHGWTNITLSEYD